MVRLCPPSMNPVVIWRAASGDPAGAAQRVEDVSHCTPTIDFPSADTDTDRYCIKSLEMRRRSPPGYVTSQIWSWSPVFSCATTSKPLPSGSQVRSRMVRQRLPAIRLTLPVAVSTSDSDARSPPGSSPSDRTTASRLPSGDQRTALEFIRSPAFSDPSRRLPLPSPFATMTFNSPAPSSASAYAIWLPSGEKPASLEGFIVQIVAIRAESWSPQNIDGGRQNLDGAGSFYLSHPETELAAQ